MKKNLLSNTLIAIAVVLLASCTSNNPEKLIVGTWEGVSEVEVMDASFPTVIDYKKQTITYYETYYGVRHQTTKEFPCRSILRLSEDGKLTNTTIDTKIGVVTEIIEGDYELKENGQELSFFYPTESVDYKVEIQNLTRHKLVLVTTKYMPYAGSYFIIYTTSTYKR